MRVDLVRTNSAFFAAARFLGGSSRTSALGLIVWKLKYRRPMLIIFSSLFHWADFKRIYINLWIMERFIKHYSIFNGSFFTNYSNLILDYSNLTVLLRPLGAALTRSVDAMPWSESESESDESFSFSVFSDFTGSFFIGEDSDAEALLKKHYSISNEIAATWFCLLKVIALKEKALVRFHDLYIFIFSTQARMKYITALSRVWDK